MLTCYHCAKIIAKRAQFIHVQPSNLALSLGDFARAYHTSCHEKAEQIAISELAKAAGQGR